MKYMMIIMFSTLVYSEETLDSLENSWKNFIGMNLSYEFSSANGSLTNANYPDYVDYETPLKDISSGLGFSLTYISNYKLSKKKYIDRIKLGLGLSYSFYDLSFKSIESFRSIYEDNQVIPLIETNNVDVTINSFSIKPNIFYQLNNDTTSVFFISLSPSIIFNSTASSSRFAKIENPGVFYENGRNKSEMNTEEFEINSINSSLNIGLLGLTDLNFFSAKIPSGRYNLSYGLNYEFTGRSHLLDLIPINVFSFHIGCGIAF